MEREETGLAAFSPHLAPAEITCDFDGMRERLSELIAPYEGMGEEGAAALDLREAKSCRADLNRIIKSVEDGRKAVKRAYGAPLQEFEAEVKELLAPAVEARDLLDAAVKSQEAERRGALREALECAYREFAPALADAVPFERVCDPKWLNLSYGQAKAELELCERAAAVARDWEALRTLALPCHGAAEREFFRTLSIERAVSAANEAAAEQARIDALRAEVDANRAASAPQEPEEAPQEEPEPQGEPEPACVYVAALEMAAAQRDALVAWFRANGVHGNMAPTAFGTAGRAWEELGKVIANG